METKTQRAVSLLKAGDVKEALKIFKTFRLGLSKEEMRTIGIACECLCGNGDFYSSIGIDCRQAVNEAVAVVSAKYL